MVTYYKGIISSRSTCVYKGIAVADPGFDLFGAEKIIKIVNI